VSPFALLGNRDFLKVWVVGLLVGTVRWLEMLAMGVFVFDMTGSPVQVALVSVLRMVPLALCGIPAGALVERVPRVLLVRVGLAIMLAVSLVLAWLAYSDRIAVWHIAVGALVNGIFWVVDMPARRTLLVDIAGLARTGQAMTLESITNNGTRMLGPVFGGLLLQVLGLDGTFVLSASLYGLGLVSFVRLDVRERHPDGPREGLLTSLAGGVRIALRHRTMKAILVVTLIFNLWGFPMVTMIPVLGKEVLGLSAFPVGLLTSAEGAGAFLGALLLTFTGRPVLYRALYVSGVLLYVTMSLGFGQSTLALLSGLLLLGAGLGGAAFAAMQSTLVLLNAPEEARSRMMGVLMVCIGAAPIGFAHIGLLASWLGAPTAVSVTAIEGMIALTIALLVWPELSQPQPVPE
jgi:MFS family permease